ncbi:VOC family protein [Ancylobacter dichloromethanicus]|uniref:Ring-cleavage extradiol dioxygenase n=1 Tax=Ancylobacter dichloromethanicus TaxID=518825 RepID=A0A9W6J446_9HYPH|nr:VOC family protein [Ancylobacter dichloromethanicus]MBS7555363.1 VOC family protein [Ancylobacter dichloromethanicus]GLK70545.1 ring-cleavage extradiol dioxygenase [Ancylobacter dichloromethanicus]
MTTTPFATFPPSVPQATAPVLPAGLRLGAVRLRVRDAARAAAFYTGTVGLTLLGTGEDGSLRLGIGEDTLVELVGAPAAGPRPHGTTGLFHVAILVPDRPSLAVVLRRLVAKGVRLGASDHLVSEALYLDDPDGNGIEIYRDRPAGEWRWDGATVEMATQPLDLRNLLAECPEGVPLDAPMPDGTRIGHVHLQVGDLAAARRFYVDHLGFAVTTDRYPGALFVSAGGYHHHLGLNIWQSRHGGPPPANSVGLIDFDVLLPDAASVEAARARLAAAGEVVAPSAGGFAVSDPWGTRLHIHAPG